MLNIKSIIYLVSLALISLFIIVFKPEMHKQAIITDSEYEFAQVILPPAQLQPSDANMEVKPVQTANKPIVSSGYNIEQQKLVTNNNQYSNKPVQSVRQPVKSQNVQRQQVSKPQQVSKSNTQKSQNNTTVQNAVPQKQKTSKQQSVPQTKQIKMSEQTPIVHKEKPILTEQEEIIAWNRWRSRLQNQVMMDTKISAPLGTTFKFTFTVDKYGNMSNVKVWCTTPMFNDLAVSRIKPVLMGYRNKPIFNFPEGTRRIITNVEGGFTMSRSTQYSTPENYHDYEHIRH